MRVDAARRGPRVLVVIVLAALAFSGCVVDFTGNLAGTKVAMLGDSLLGKSADQQHLRLDPTYQTSINAGYGSTIAKAQPVGAELAALAPPILVVDLGTNDAWNSVPTDTSIADYDHIVDQFPTSCLVVVTIVDTVPGPAGSPYHPELAAALNDHIRAYATRNDAVVVDWQAALIGHEAEYNEAADGIHQTELGKAVLADLVGAGVDECQARLLARPS